MIRGFTGQYLRFEDESSKRKDNLIIIEILNRKMDDIALIVCNETHLLLSTIVESITEISGYHRYISKSGVISPFGIGGLSRIPTDSQEGMLEGMSKAAHIDYIKFAENFGRGLLEMDKDYVFLLE